MEVHEGKRRADHFPTTSSFPNAGNHHPEEDRQDHLNGGYYHQQPDNRHHHNFIGEQNEPNGYHINSNSNPFHLSGQKRQLHHPSSVDYGGFVKLYVVGIPRDATEQDVAAVFGEYGHILEIVLVKDKWTGLQQEFCFVKYAEVEQAERAIRAFQSQYTFPGAVIPMIVKYAVGERERLGAVGAHHKLYVGCVHKQAFEWEIEEIFSPYGVVEDVFIVRDEFRQSRGSAFVQFSCRQMAVAAIQALNGTYVMKGCDQPLVVRFASPKKPRVGDSRPIRHLNDPSNVHMLSNEMQQMKPSPSRCKTMLAVSNLPASQSFRSTAEIGRSIDCDWSEHVCPDGDLYYYNCVTCESRWEKPVEYDIYEHELDYLEEKLQRHKASNPEELSSPEGYQKFS